jgi:hypothetical protein
MHAIECDYALGDRVHVVPRGGSGFVGAILITGYGTHYRVDLDDGHVGAFRASELEPLVVNGVEVAP